MKRSFAKTLSVLLFAHAVVSVASGDVLTPDTQRWDANIFPSLPLGALKSPNAECRADSHKLLRSLNNLTTWAFQMWDASAKRPTGLSTGTVYALGDFDECVQVRNAKYCLPEVRVHATPTHEIDKYSLEYDPDEVVFNHLFFTGDTSRVRLDTVKWALCVPKSCPEEDIQDALNEYLEKIAPNSTANVTYDVKLLSGTCQTDRSDERFDAADIAFCVTMSVIALIVITASARTFYLYYRPRTGNQERSATDNFMREISIQKSVYELTTGVSESLSNIRFASMVCVIMYHRGGTMMSGPLINYDVITHLTRSLWLLPIHRGDVIVDTFFLLSGLMAIQKFMRELDKHPIRLIFERYIRLTPVYAVVIFYIATVYYKSGSGPLWDTVVGIEWKSCRSNWWTNLLYVNNYVNEEQLCMVQSWYLPCDMHFFIASALILPLLVKHTPRAVLPSLILFLIASILSPFLITLLGNKPAVLHFQDDFVIAPRSNDLFRSVYIKSHTRAGAYIVGLLIGYTLHAKRQQMQKMTSIHALSLAISGFALMLGVTYGAALFLKDNTDGTLLAALYAGLNRPAWGLACAAVLVAATQGKLFVNVTTRTTRPRRMFINLLGKLSYATYIVHMQFQMKFVAETRSPYYINLLEMIRFGLGDVTASFMCAFILYIFVEGPVKAILKYFTTAKKSTKINHQDSNRNIAVQLNESAKYKKHDLSLHI